MIENLTDFELTRKLLEHRNITLEEALDKARAWEAAGRQASNMTTSPPLAEERGIWPGIGTVLREERSMQSVEGMDILLCVVVVRGTVM